MGKVWRKRGFNITGTLLQTANEFQEQLEKFDENYLIIRVIESMVLFFTQFHWVKYENILNQYRLTILEFLEKKLILYTNGISKQIQYIKSGIE